jgi:hypothetical protein
MTLAKARKRKCKVCGDTFIPSFNTFQKTCGDTSCMVVYGKQEQKKQVERDRKAAKRKIREGDVRWWLAVGNAEAKMNGGNAAYWVHRWVRLVRDKDKPCIMCGSFEPKGGHWDACHYRSRGAASHLRLDPLNIHKGCTWCNTNTTSDTGLNFRQNLISRIGKDEVEWLDSNNDLKKWTIDDCRLVRDQYKALCYAAGVTMKAAT